MQKVKERAAGAASAGEMPTSRASKLSHAEAARRAAQADKEKATRTKPAPPR